MNPDQIAELRERVITAMTYDGFSRDKASARVVVRHSQELGQNSLTVIGTGACSALDRAVGHGVVPGTIHTEIRWQDRVQQRNNGQTHPRNEHGPEGRIH